MKQYINLLIIMSMIGIIILSGCDSNVTQQDNVPPSISQESGSTAISTSTAVNTNLIPGQYIVVFKDQANGLINENTAQQALQRTQSIMNSYNIESDSIMFKYRYALKGFAAKLTTEQVKALQNDPGIDNISQAQMYRLGTELLHIPALKTNFNTIFRSQTIPWGVTRVGGPLDGTGKRAWILDTGIDLSHPDLNVDVANSVSFIANESADDQVGHGTHVAGIIAAKNNNRDVVGVAAGATVVAIKVCTNVGCPSPQLLNGIDYISDKAAPQDIVNMSIWNTIGIDTDLDNAVLAAANNGVRMVLIAGNIGGNANNHSPGRLNHQNIWTVSAFDSQDKFASFSNYGNPPIDYSGPGVDVLSLWKNGGTKTESGTSMAAPHIAGLLLVVPDSISIDGYVNDDPDGVPDPIAAYTPFGVALSGPAFVNSGVLSTWTATPENGSGNYQYQWYYRDHPQNNWIADGTNSTSYQKTFTNTSGVPETRYVLVKITDLNNNDTTEASKTIYVCPASRLPIAIC